jgi:4-alpha-glucanotransferase
VERGFVLFDLLRLDHFRGYGAVWVYPPKSWLAVPGERILQAVKNKFPDKTFIAEDLGVITEEIAALRRKFGFWGMKVLVWDDPAKIEADSVVYTSVHDSSPLRGRFSQEKVEDLISQARQSPAKILIYAMQDLLGLGEEARLNRPGTKKNNWNWKIPDGIL